MDSGKKYLIEWFYRPIRSDTPVPILYRETLLTDRPMDAIFGQLWARPSHGHLGFSSGASYIGNGRAHDGALISRHVGNVASATMSASPGGNGERANH